MLMVSDHAGGQETNYPNQTFSKCVKLSLVNGGFKEEVKQQPDKQYIKVFEAMVTFYTNGIEETGKNNGDKDYGVTASGRIARPNRTIAMDKSIPYNTVVEIDTLGTFVVEDRGGKIHNNHIDVFVSRGEDLNKLGVKHLQARIIKWGDGKRSE
jgi:3D (Asp-Asp-Asp) domain-containing protein